MRHRAYHPNFSEMNLPPEQCDHIPDAINLKALNAWAELCSSIRAGNAKYHPSKVVGLLKQFADSMLAHMEKTMAALDVGK